MWWCCLFFVLFVYLCGGLRLGTLVVVVLLRLGVVNGIWVCLLFRCFVACYRFAWISLLACNGIVAGACCACLFCLVLL